MTIHIEHLSLRLPAGYGARAESISRGVVEGIGQFQLSGSRVLPLLRLQPIRVGSDASDAQIIQSVLRQVAAALELQA